MPENPIAKDLKRLGIPLPSLPRLQLPRVPAPPGLQRPAGAPSTPLESVAALPGTVRDTLQTGLDTLAEIPNTLATDALTLANNLLSLPGMALQEALRVPGDLIEKLSPPNVQSLVDGLKTNLDFRGVTPAEFQQRARTVTDFIPFL
ncbi:hypothetical protein LCGC14_2842080 [marine sediment metagenome]|uniref:Uncharacterized protein n=1 Tax=marine sediment metagenome TaxID=412755 RepID=A0A0F9AJC2_9ZZZZ